MQGPGARGGQHCAQEYGEPATIAGPKLQHGQRNLPRMKDMQATTSAAESAARYPFARNMRLTLTEPCILKKMA